MNDEPRRVTVTLSKADRSTPVGRELIALLTELADDGQVTGQEMEQLRAWLEVDRAVDFPACAFLYSVVEPISTDGVITEEELDSLARAIERVLPADVRAAAALKRREHRAARREALAAKRAAEREKNRSARIAAQKRGKALHRARFVVRGALRSAERRESCEGLAVGAAVTLEREPDNRHDANAVLVLTPDGCEMGYVPREDAKQMAPLLDAGVEVEATVHKLWQTPDGGVVPIIVATLRRGDSTPAALGAPASRGATRGGATRPRVTAPGRSGCLVVVVCVLLLALVAAQCCGG